MTRANCQPTCQPRPLSKSELLSSSGSRQSKATLAPLSNVDSRPGFAARRPKRRSRQTSSGFPGPLQTPEFPAAACESGSMGLSVLSAPLPGQRHSDSERLSVKWPGADAEGHSGSESPPLASPQVALARRHSDSESKWVTVIQRSADTVIRIGRRRGSGSFARRRVRPISEATLAIHRSTVRRFRETLSADRRENLSYVVVPEWKSAPLIPSLISKILIRARACTWAASRTAIIGSVFTAKPQLLPMAVPLRITIRSSQRFRQRPHLHTRSTSQ